MDPYWNTTGNRGTDPTKDFLGTTDEQPLVISTSNAERLRITADGQAWFKGMLRTDLGHVTTNSPNGALVLNAGPPDATGAAGIWFRETTVLGNITAYTDLMRVTGDGNAWLKGTLSIDSGQITTNSPKMVFLLAASPLPTTPTLAGTGVGGIRFQQLRLNPVHGLPGQPPPPEFITYDLMVLTGDGKLGIGTDQPDATLDVRGQASIQGPLSINHAGVTGVGSPGDPRAAIYFGASDTPAAYFLGAYDGNSPKANMLLGVYSYQFGGWLQYWSPNGNIGIGTTQPTSKLTVNGDVSVSGDVILTGADCAEEFDIAEAVDFEPGTVMVIDQDGFLQQSHQAYDKRVAGVISGAGDYQPGLILDRRQSQDNRVPIALVGKVYCKVDAQYSPIEIGDLLTTSPTPGYAMKAVEPQRAFGSIIGKALKPLEGGQGLIPLLIALQ